MIRLDTNYIVRYLTNDNEEMAIIVEDIILNKKTYISNEVLAEVVYVLIGVYEIPKQDVSDMLIKLISFKNIQDEIKTFDKKLLKCIENN